jgi:hypothetical protein
MCGGVSVLRYSALQAWRCAQYLVAVRMATEARYHVAYCPGLRDPELGHRPPVGWGFGRFLLLVVDAALLEGWDFRVA